MLTIGMAFVGVGIAFWVLGAYGGPFRRWLALGIALVAMLPYFFLEAIFPHAFDLTCYAKTVDYQFRDRAYARAFARLNDAVVSTA